MPRPVLIAYAAIAAAALFQIYHYQPLLPERLATRFDFDGAPNGWMGKEGFAIYYMGLLAFIMGICAASGALMKRMSPRFINIPHRSYWLAPERRAESLRFLTALSLWTGVLTSAMIVGLMEMIFRTNLTAAPTLDGRIFYPALGLLAVFVVMTIVWTYRRFPNPNEKV